MTKRYLIAIDTTEIPGRVIATFVRFEREIFKADDPAFLDGRFCMLPADLPESQLIKQVLDEKPDGSFRVMGKVPPR